ncbi:MAG: hypothetical protein DI539_30840 [Flavobacterium psychrophilum]|nr:MAG: hypothetical protein DI539_30840 [Flavobacterium psychrophilum]
MRTDFIKVRTHLNTGLRYDSNGKFTQEFRNSLYEHDEDFRSKVIIPINELVGLHNWAIDFVEVPGIGFFADIFADSESNYYAIRSIISAKIPDTDFEYFFKGNVSSSLS